MKVKRMYFLMLITFLNSCTDFQKKYIINKGKDVSVKLKLTNKVDLEKINFYSERDSTSILKNKISEYNNFEYNFKNSGEGLLSLEMITGRSDTIFGNYYVEKGYKIELNFINDSLEYQVNTIY